MKYKFEIGDKVMTNEPLDFRKTGGPFIPSRCVAKVVKRFRGTNKAVFDFGEIFGKRIEDCGVFDKTILRKFKFTRIKWDTDGIPHRLPLEYTYKTFDHEFNPEWEGADILSNKFGYCVEDFRYEEIKK